ncbi:MAG: aminotransferase class I/II-fold pyridoxal phosphate-dependent enzyme [Kordiimonadaceae bacterium]|jgi:histidinol-phosphate aminotransferase|nr:aminotransferase class I/II-fold pyridoxal phosphate-dependent enzyme [Kordiimonadaceae bacterium]MBT6036017.1 aminotransferase class I/II-fold pyridoxal phosphate-dependent enzyme [Kordiimonadaceae bacterium]MBT6329865.1 aminotransferase class I/II-fold pyridoxal phosphate-dependent enzyme [Kordiimonadaceae bacterium]
MIKNITRREWLAKGSVAVGTASIASLLGGQSYAATVEMPGPDGHVDDLLAMGGNENPYGPSKKTKEAILTSFHELSRYNFSLPVELKSVVGAVHNISADHIEIGCGSNEILRAVGLIAAENNNAVLAADPTFYSLYRHSQDHGSNTIFASSTDKMTLSLDAMRSAMTDDVKVIYICNPDNPIPTIIEENELKEFCLEMSKRAIVIIDEAYAEYCQNPDFGSMIDLVREGHNNIIVTRTASKIYGLAALRVGFAFAHPDLIKKLMIFKTSSSRMSGGVAMHAAIAAYKDSDYLDFMRKNTRNSLKIAYNMFEELNIPYIKSDTNFTLFDAGIPTVEVGKRMLKHNVKVGRPFPPLTTWVRLSMVQTEQMPRFVEAYKREFG